MPSHIRGPCQLLPQGPTGYLGEGPSWGEAPNFCITPLPVAPFSAYIHKLRMSLVVRVPSLTPTPTSPPKELVQTSYQRVPNLTPDPHLRASPDHILVASPPPRPLLPPHSSHRLAAP